MSKIFPFFFILIWISFQNLQGENKRTQIAALRKKIISLQKENKNTESIPYLQRYLELNPTEIHYKLIYAKALLFQENFQLPVPDEDIFSRSEKLNSIKANYAEAARVFEESVNYLLMAQPRDPNLGKWHFLWGISELFAGNKEKAIHVFLKANKIDFTLSDSFYNVAVIYESLGQDQDAKLYWRKFEKSEKELKEAK